MQLSPGQITNMFEIGVSTSNLLLLEQVEGYQNDNGLNAVDPNVIRTRRLDLVERVKRGEIARWFPLQSSIGDEAGNILATMERLGSLSDRTAPMMNILIPARDESDTLPNLLDSITVQETNSPVRVFLADNNSTDGTAQLAEARGCNVVKASIKGCSPARRAALQALVDASLGEKFEQFVVQTDADCELEGTNGTNYLASVGAFFEQHPNILASSGPIHYHLDDGRVIASKGDFTEEFEVDMSLENMFDLLGRDRYHFLQGRKRAHYLPGGNSAYRLEPLKTAAINFPEEPCWESIFMSFILQSHFSTDSVAVNPKQIVATKARGEMTTQEAGMRYLTPFKAPDTIPPLTTLQDLIQRAEQASYRLRPDERITGYDLASDVLTRLVHENGIRFSPALITATGRLITGLYARISIKDRS